MEVRALSKAKIIIQMALWENDWPHSKGVHLVIKAPFKQETSIIEHICVLEKTYYTSLFAFKLRGTYSLQTTSPNAIEKRTMLSKILNFKSNEMFSCKSTSLIF